MRKFGFSLSEILICVAIVLVVAALALPVLTTVKVASQESVTRTNLRQIWLALELYAEDHPTSGEGIFAYGYPPTDHYYNLVHEKLNLRPPLAGRFMGVGWYYLLPPEPGIHDVSYVKNWREYMTRCDEQVAVVADFNFSDVDPFGSPYLPKRSIAVALAGNILTQSRIGTPVFPQWWHCHLGANR